MRRFARVWQFLSVIIAVALLIEGLVILSVAAPVTIQGGGTIAASDLQFLGLLIILIGAASIAFGLLSVLRPKLVEEGSRLGITSKLIKVLGGVAIAIEAIVLALMAGKMTIEGLGTFERYVVAAFIGQLFFLGTTLLVLELIGSLEFRINRFFMYLGALAVAAEGVVIIGIAEETMIEGLGGILERTVLIGGAQLLVIGLVFLVSCLMVDRFVRFTSIFSILRLLSGAIIIIEGLAIAAMATVVTPADIGSITTRTLIIAGIQLALIGGVALLMAGGRRTSKTLRLGKVTAMAAVFLMLLIPAALLTVGKFW